LIVSLPYVPANNTICTFSPLGIVIVSANVTVVSTNDVVKLAAVTVAVASASNNVPLGSPALSVSILTHKSTQGLIYFLNANFNVLLATPLPKAMILTLVFAAVSPIACTWLALAKVTISSTNTLSLASMSSPANSHFSYNADGDDASVILSSTYSLVVKSSSSVGVGAFGATKNVFSQAIVSLPVRCTTSSSSALSSSNLSISSCISLITSSLITISTTAQALNSRAVFVLVVASSSIGTASYALSPIVKVSPVLLTTYIFSLAIILPSTSLSVTLIIKFSVLNLLYGQVAFNDISVLDIATSSSHIALFAL